MPRYGFLGSLKPLSYLVPSHLGLRTSTISVSERGLSSMNGPLPTIMPLSHWVWSSSSSTALGIGKNSWKPATASKLE